jgi:hypothetical protein
LFLVFVDFYREIRKNVYLNDGIPNADHVLGQVLHQGEEATLGVEPRVSAQLFAVGLQRLDDSADAELVVALGAVQSTFSHVQTLLHEYELCFFYSQRSTQEKT